MAPPRSTIARGHTGERARSPRCDAPRAWPAAVSRAGSRTEAVMHPMTIAPSAEHERFVTLYERHASLVLAYARRRIGADDAEDVLAETFLVAWRRRDDVPDDALPWLYAVAGNVLRNRARSARRRARARRGARWPRSRRAARAIAARAATTTAGPRRRTPRGDDGGRRAAPHDRRAAGGRRRARPATARRARPAAPARSRSTAADRLGRPVDRARRARRRVQPSDLPRTTAPCAQAAGAGLGE